MTIPPALLPLMLKSTCHGMLLGSASLPPMILWWPEMGFNDRPQTMERRRGHVQTLLGPTAEALLKRYLAGTLE